MARAVALPALNRRGSHVGWRTIGEFVHVSLGLEDRYLSEIEAETLTDTHTLRNRAAVVPGLAGHGVW